MRDQVNTPDNWCILKITYDGETTYKVFAEWQGGYTSGDEWRMNSGIVDCDLQDGYYVFSGFSGSKYFCPEHNYGIRGIYAIGILDDLLERMTTAGGVVDVLDKDTNFLEVDWGLHVN